jgi:cobyrinic acid a,c-diamide synthase
LLVAGTSSGAGKTSTTLALLCALEARGIEAAAAKCGPDYIDAGFLTAMTGRAAPNLDVWMSRVGGVRVAASGCGADRERFWRREGTLPTGLARLFARLCATADMVVAEGAMALYDGADGGVGSAAHLAVLLRLPVLLVISAASLGQSVGALAEGFLCHHPSWLPPDGPKPVFAGIVCSHVGREKHRDMLRAALSDVEERLHVPLLGLLPREGAPQLASRHLGLVQAEETELDSGALADWFEANCDLDLLLERIGFGPKRSGRASAMEARPASVVRRKPAYRACPAAGIRVGIARDAAFSFCYADLPDLLVEFGARCVFFSPLADAAPPSCDALYFPGGYPELHAGALAANTAMLSALRRVAARGTPVYGECGGYMYLMRSLRSSGVEYVMSGLLPLDCEMDGKWAALGYRAVRALPDGAGRGGLWARGHEFHYGRIVGMRPLECACSPLWRVYDSRGEDLGEEGCRKGNVSGSWVHLYPEGARAFWKLWLAGVARGLNDIFAC